MSQLALPLKLADHAVFSSFYPGGNAAAVAFLRDRVLAGADRGCWLWGAAGTGKSHLLQAVCEQAGDRAQYLPLHELNAAGPAILEGLGSRELLCLDDLHAVAGDAAWELALFELSNQLADNGGVIVVSAVSPPRDAGIRLNDLVSRMTRLPVFHLQPLDDAGRIEALRLRAQLRGLELPLKTANYILRRSKRDMATLYGQLDKLDSAALQAKRKLSIPFVRDVLEL